MCRFTQLFAPRGQRSFQVFFQDSVFVSGGAGEVFEHISLPRAEVSLWWCFCGHARRSSKSEKYDGRAQGDEQPSGERVKSAGPILCAVDEVVSVRAERLLHRARVGFGCVVHFLSLFCCCHAGHDSVMPSLFWL